jgi:hypothetical protein
MQVYPAAALDENFWMTKHDVFMSRAWSEMSDGVIQTLLKDSI